MYRSQFSIFVGSFIACLFGTSNLTGQIAEDIFRQEVKELTRRLDSTNDFHECYSLLSSLRLYDSHAESSLKSIRRILLEPAFSENLWIGPPNSVHGCAHEVLRVIGPSSVPEITSLLKDANLSETTIIDLLSTASDIAIASQSRFPELAMEIERMFDPPSSISEPLAAEAVSTYGLTASSNEDALAFVLQLMPDEHANLKINCIKAIGDLAFASPDAVRALRCELIEIQQYSEASIEDSINWAIIIAYEKIGLRDLAIEEFLVTSVQNDRSSIWRVDCANALVPIDETRTIGLNAMGAELKRILDQPQIKPEDIRILARLFAHYSQYPTKHVLEMTDLFEAAVFRRELDSQRSIAFEILCKSGSDRLSVIATKLVQSDYEPVRIMAFDYLSQKDLLHKHIELVFDGLDNSNWETQINTAQILGRLGSEATPALQRLDAIWKDQNNPIKLRREAYRSIQRIRML